MKLEGRNKNMQDAGKVIKLIAKEKNIKLLEIAKNTGMVYETLSVKLSKSKFRIAELDKIAKTLNCTVQIEFINPDTGYKKISDNIIVTLLSIMDEKHLNQSELSRKIGTSKQNVSMLFKSDPDAFQIQQIITLVNALEYSLKIVFIDNITKKHYIICDNQPVYRQQLEFLNSLLLDSSLSKHESDEILSKFKNYLEGEVK